MIVGDTRCQLVGTGDMGNGLGPTQHWVEAHNGVPVLEHLVAANGAWHEARAVQAVPAADFATLGNA